jgi:hypothetical protein
MLALRLQALGLDPIAVDFLPSPTLPRVFGGVMDTAYPEAVATLVALADGTTSLYTTGTFGIIGGGAHQPVVEAAGKFLASIEAHLDVFGDDAGTALPTEGPVVIHALTYAGRRRISATEDDFGYRRHSASPVFHAAHDVISALRQIHEGRPEGQG